MKNQLTLLHFETVEDLLAGVDTLKQYNIIISEIYSAAPIPGIETKLRMDQLRLGEAIIRYGFIGGMGLISLGYYFVQTQANWKTILLNILVLFITLFLAGCFSQVNVPRFFTLKRGDKRYLIVVDTQRIPVNESIVHLFQYANAVELSSALKNIMIS